jgi:hypothetical protein
MAALMETLRDDFQFGGVDTGKWTDPGSQCVVGTTLDLKLTSALAGNYIAYASLTTYNLTGSYAFVQLKDVGNQALTSWEVYPVYLIADSNNKIFIRITGNQVQAIKVVAGVTANVGSSVAYSPLTMKWFRIRELSGRTYFEYAASPSGTWTEITPNIANVITLTTLTAEVLIGTWQAEASTTTAVFDNFNCLPGANLFSWKGLSWNKRIHAGPPANNQTWSSSNISVSPTTGYLNLQLTNPTGNAPVGCEIFSEKRGFGYGTYTVVVDARLDNIGSPASFGGLFTFDFTSAPDYKEIDAGEVRDYASNPNKRILKNHVYNNAGSRAFVTDDLDVPSSPLQTHRMIWEPNKITFDSYLGEGINGTNYSHVVHTTNIPTPGLERVHFNIFVDSTLTGYLNVSPLTVVVRNFSFSHTPRKVIRNFKSSLLFDGTTNSYVNVYTTAFASQFNGAEGSMSLWVRHNNWFGGVQGYAIGFRVDASNLVRIVKEAANTLTFQYSAGGTTELITITGNTLRTSEWMHLAFTWSKSGEVVNAYINGVLVGTSTSLGTWAGTLISSSQLIGAGSTTGARWQGLITDVKLWTTALSTTQINNLYFNNQVPGSSLIGSWSLGEGAGSTANDTSGQSNNGVITGATYSSEVPMKTRSLINKNLVKNGDFEFAPPTNVAQTSGLSWIDGTVGGSASNSIFGWVTDLRFATSSSVKFDSTNLHAGSYALKASLGAVGSFIEITQFTPSSLYKTYAMPALPNTSYTCTYWMKTNYVSGDSSDGATVNILEIDGSGNDLTAPTSTKIKTTTDWTQYTVTWTTNASTRYLRIRPTIYGHTGAATLIMDAWFDDIVLKPTTPAQRLVTRDFGTSLNFPGTSSFVSRTSGFVANNTAFTVSFWAKTTLRSGSAIAYSENIPASWPNSLFAIYFGDTNLVTNPRC